MKLELCQDTTLKKVIMNRGDRIITNGYRLKIKKLDLTNADEYAITPDGRTEKGKSWMEIQDFEYIKEKK